MSNNDIISVTKYRVDEEGNQHNPDPISIESHPDNTYSVISVIKKSIIDMSGVELVKIEDITNKNNRSF